MLGDSWNSQGNRIFLYINNGDTFAEAAISRGIATNDGNPHFGTSATCGDFNNDGWLDIHVNQWDQLGIQAPHTKLFKNIGNGFFVDDTENHEFDFSSVESNLCSIFSDYDKDGDQDLFIISDTDNSQFYTNENGRYVKYAENVLPSGRAAAIGDIDDNGYLDIFISSIPNQNSLFTCDEADLFRDRTNKTNVSNSFYSWGSLFFDFDNDGDLDIVVANGDFNNVQGLTDPVVFWENNEDLDFELKSVGLDDSEVGKSVLSLDYDNDGDLDLLISHTGNGAYLFENKDSSNGFLRIRLVGEQSNSFGIGAQIFVWLSKTTIVYHEVGSSTTGHFLGNSLTDTHFGIGNVEIIEKIEVYWPVSQITTTRNNIRKNSMLTIYEDKSSEKSYYSSDSPITETSSSMTLFVPILLLSTLFYLYV